MDKPGGLQHVFELIHGFVDGRGATTRSGMTADSHMVLFETLVHLPPACQSDRDHSRLLSPTQVIYVPAGCALLAFLYYNLVGLQEERPGQVRRTFRRSRFWWMAPLMIPIEIISHLARPLSLTIRLFANMYAGEQVTLVFLSLTYLVGPAMFMGLHVFVGLLQAYIFVLLTMMYVAGAVAEEH